jgi:hypothetical protein
MQATTVHKSPTWEIKALLCPRRKTWERASAACSWTTQLKTFRLGGT